VQLMNVKVHKKTKIRK